MQNYTLYTMIYTDSKQFWKIFKTIKSSNDISYVNVVFRENHKKKNTWEDTVILVSQNYPTVLPPVKYRKHYSKNKSFKTSKLSWTKKMVSNYCNLFLIKIFLGIISKVCF